MIDLITDGTALLAQSFNVDESIDLVVVVVGLDNAGDNGMTFITNEGDGILPSLGLVTFALTRKLSLDS